MRRYRRGSEWAAILEEYKRSGMSVKSFCRERGLCATSIYRRRGKENRSPEFIEFIELAHGDVSASYEISVDGVTLKVPISVRRGSSSDSRQGSSNRKADRRKQAPSAPGKLDTFWG